MTLVYVCCSSECLYTGEEHLCGQWRPLHCYASCSFSFRDANNGHLACFPPSASTVYSHVLVWTWWSVEYHSHTFPCLGTVVSDTVHAAWHNCFYTASLPCQSIQEPCSRPPFQEDSGLDWTLQSAVPNSGLGPRVWKASKLSDPSNYILRWKLVYAFLPVHGLTTYWSKCFYTGLSLLSSQYYVGNEIAS